MSDQPRTAAARARRELRQQAARAADLAARGELAVTYTADGWKIVIPK